MARRRTTKRAPAAERPARQAVKAQSAEPRGRGTAKPSATRRGTRSTAASKAKPSARASGGTGTASRDRPRKRAATSRQRSGARRAAARPGQRQDDVLRLVRENPGITVREIGERLGVDATSLYRVVNRLVDERRVRKDGTRLEPVDSPTPTASKPEVAPQTTRAAAGPETPQAAQSSESEAARRDAARSSSGGSN